MIETLIKSLHEEKQAVLSKAELVEYAMKQAVQIEILQELIIKNANELITCKNNLESIIKEYKMENIKPEINELLLPEVNYLISVVEAKEEEGLEIDHIIEEQENRIEAEKVIDASLIDAVHELENNMRQEMDNNINEAIMNNVKEEIKGMRRQVKKRPVRQMK